jgi:hypothetical protein
MRTFRLLAALAAPVVIAAGCATAALDGTGTPGDPDEPVAVDEVTTFWLPSGSARLGASGRATPRVCAGLVWDFSNTGRPLERSCDEHGDGFPYAVLTLVPSGPCGAVWDYHPNAVIKSLSGCIEPHVGEGPPARLDITATISGALFVGEIHLATP